jgi:hypothetical protein
VFFSIYMKRQREKSVEEYVLLCRENNKLVYASLLLSETQRNTIRVVVDYLRDLMALNDAQHHVLRTFDEKVLLVTTLYKGLEECRERELFLEHHRLQDGEEWEKYYHERVEGEVTSIHQERDKDIESMGKYRSVICRLLCQENCTKLQEENKKQKEIPESEPLFIEDMVKPYSLLDGGGNDGTFSSMIPTKYEDAWKLVIYMAGPTLSRTCRKMYSLVIRNRVMWINIFKHTDLYSNLQSCDVPVILPSTRNLVVLAMVDNYCYNAREELKEYALKKEYYSPYTACHKGRSLICCPPECCKKQLFMKPRILKYVTGHRKHYSYEYNEFVGRVLDITRLLISFCRVHFPTSKFRIK